MYGYLPLESQFDWDVMFVGVPYLYSDAFPDLKDYDDLLMKIVLPKVIHYCKNNLANFKIVYFDKSGSSDQIFNLGKQKKMFGAPSKKHKNKLLNFKMKLFSRISQLTEKIVNL